MGGPQPPTTFIFYIDIKCHYIFTQTHSLPFFCAEKKSQLEALHLKFSASEQSEKLYLWINSWERRKVVKCVSLGSIFIGFTIYVLLSRFGEVWGRCWDIEWKEQICRGRYFYSHGACSFLNIFSAFVAFCSHRYVCVQYNIRRSKFQITYMICWYWRDHSFGVELWSQVI